MRIGIDAQTILNPAAGEAVGVGHYTFMLIRNLLKVDEDFKAGKNEYVLFFDNRVRKKDIKRFENFGVKIRHFPFSSYRRYLPGVYSEVLLNSMFAREKLDVLHSPGGIIPLTYRGKKVVTEANMAIHKFSDMFPRYQRLSASFNRTILSRANSVITNSEAVKKDVIDFFGIPPEKITPICKGIDKRFFDRVDRKEINRVREKYKIKDKYFLFLSTIKPINNLVRLIRTFATVHQGIAKDLERPHYQLVLAGKEGWLSAEEIRETARELRIENDIILTGYIPPEDLNGLFQGADLFLFPPYYEEFGTPALEAMASGIPVIASKIPALEEVLGASAVFVDPDDDKGWMGAINSVMRDESRREELKKAGLEQAKKYSWEKTARETLDIYKKVK